MNYANLFKQLRDELGLNQEQMAERLGCSQSAISKIEKGHVDPPLEVFLRAWRLTGKQIVSKEVFEGFAKVLSG